ncbi:hypothetical protein D9619_010692 [Psilocybe cf. subviscida]|uniref:Uncharacterized protein n=1 Tax=Psilocybe cf. subviscida TaxID=2480587 RepID=A0A8H5B8N7_9AGAR|nr:hypothetical protein D9619_010692 [Psilocybe cf. subviscida]
MHRFSLSISHQPRPRPVLKMAPQVKSTTILKERVFVAQGLGGQDDNIDLLGHFFDKMRETTVETAHIDDLLTFAICAPFFGVIMLETEKTVNQTCEGNDSDSDYSVHEEDAEGEFDDGGAAPNGTTPLSLNIGNPFSDAYIDVDSLSNEERVQLWRRALANDVHAEVENYNPASEAARDPSERSYLVDVSTGDGTAVTVFTPPVSPMFQQSPHSPGHAHPGRLPFFREDRAGASSNMDIDNTGRGMEMGAVTSNGSADAHGFIDASPFINWSITSPTAEEPGHGRLSVGELQDVGESFGVEPIAYDHHLRSYRERQAFQEDTLFGREGFLGYVDPPPSEPEPEADEEEDGSTDEEESEEDKEQREVLRQVERFQEQLRLKRIKEYQQNLRRQERRQERRLARQQERTEIKECKPIGLVYLYSSQAPEDFLHMGEYSMAVYVHQEHRFQHLVCPAINQVVDLAFQNQDCHRLQSVIVDNPDKLYLLEAFARSGFSNEGVRRRGYYSNIFKEWKDVTYCAMLATEWALDVTNPSGPRKARLRSESLWDEVFTRHQHECDELLRLEEKSSPLKRIPSSETIKDYNMTVDSGASNFPSTSASEAAESEAGVAGTSAKRRKIDSRRTSIRESVMSARSASISARSSQVDPSETHWNFSMPAMETAPLSIPSRAGRPIAGSSRIRQASVSGSSTSSISLQSFPSSSSSHWVDLDNERE